MKPNEIKKWLLCSTTLGENENCPPCKYNTECLKGSSLEMATITYINQLEAEIERLKDEYNRLLGSELEQYEKGYNNGYNDAHKTAKTEAVKEFAERLKEKKMNSTMDSRICTVEMIDSLVKEMVSEG